MRNVDLLYQIYINAKKSWCFLKTKLYTLSPLKVIAMISLGQVNDIMQALENIKT